MARHQLIVTFLLFLAFAFWLAVGFCDDSKIGAHSRSLEPRKTGRVVAESALGIDGKLARIRRLAGRRESSKTSSKSKGSTTTTSTSTTTSSSKAKTATSADPGDDYEDAEEGEIVNAAPAMANAGIVSKGTVKYEPVEDETDAEAGSAAETGAEDEENEDENEKEKAKVKTKGKEKTKSKGAKEKGPKKEDKEELDEAEEEPKEEDAEPEEPTSSTTKRPERKESSRKSSASSSSSGGKSAPVDEAPDGPKSGAAELGPQPGPKKKSKKPLVALPFLKAKNESVCVPEAFSEFPSDLIGNKWRSRGLVLIHISIVCYMFYALALVCERYFMPSLEEFSTRLQLSEDVAGATLMSAGSSAPELFTAILGVFIAKGDVGTGAIVGSAVFNILFVIGLCAFVSTTTAQLNWWPVFRDSIYYTFTVLVLILFIYDERITAIESFTMIALYGVYIMIMVHNEPIHDYVTRVLLSNPTTAKFINSVVTVDGPDDVFGSTSSGSHKGAGRHQMRDLERGRGGAGGAHSRVEDDSIFMAAMLMIVQHKRLFRSQLRFQSAARYIITKRQHKAQEAKRSQVGAKSSNELNYLGPENEPLQHRGPAGHKERIEAYARNATLSKNKFSIVSKDDYEFWNRPLEEGENYYIWLAKIPVNFVLHYSVPDCTLYPDKYLITFFTSIIWTAVFSYIMVWMVTLIGYTFGIPDSVMGMTFLAAGTSVPDCYSSLHAAKNGMADMAVSNSIGSNVFDILIGLSLPWFIQTAVYPGVVATINSRGVIYSVVLLFLSLIVTVYLMNKYDWTLKPRLGLALIIAYGLFIILTCMLEFNLFGHVNPPPCPVTN